jgi:hypothetical protein
LVVAALLLLASGVTLTWGPAGGPTDVSWAGLAITVAGVAVGIPLFWQRANGRSPFYGLILIATAQVITTLLTGHGLH